MRAVLHNIWTDQQGLASVEYALLMVLVGLAGIAAWQTLGDVIGNMVGECTNQIAAG